MVHNTKKMALYEVIGKAAMKPGYEQVHPKPAEPAPAAQQVSLPNVVRWVKKSRFVQFNAGRIEFSVPYQVGIAVFLAALLVIVVVFRMGERLGGKETVQLSNPVKNTSEPAKPAAVVNKPVVQMLPAAVKPVKETPKVVESKPAAADAAKQAVPESSSPAPVSTGKNRVVIQMYQVRSHLEPAKEYFDKMGVATEILEKNNWYYLVTKNKYDNPDKAGTNGYLAKQKIIELGAGYKAPPGNETFGPKPFSDAFGMKFED
jgi:hypothetical protein